MKLLIFIILIVISFPDISLARTIQTHMPSSSSEIRNAEKKIEDVLNNLFANIIKKQTGSKSTKISKIYESVQDRYSDYKLRRVDAAFAAALAKDSRMLADYYSKTADGYVESLYKSLYDKIVLEDKTAELKAHSGSNLQMFLWLYNTYVIKYDIKDSMFVFHIITGSFAKSKTCEKIAKEVASDNLSLHKNHCKCIIQV